MEVVEVDIRGFFIVGNVFYKGGYIWSTREGGSPGRTGQLLIVRGGYEWKY